jgi:hypothetical protein
MLSTSVNDCLKKIVKKKWDYELEDSCLDCFNASFKCGVKNCMKECWKDPGSEECLSCTNEHCRPTLRDCTGVGNVDALPLPPR